MSKPFFVEVLDVNRRTHFINLQQVTSIDASYSKPEEGFAVHYVNGETDIFYACDLQMHRLYFQKLITFLHEDNRVDFSQFRNG